MRQMANQEMKDLSPIHVGLAAGGMRIENGHRGAGGSGVWPAHVGRFRTDARSGMDLVIWKFESKIMPLSGEIDNRPAPVRSVSPVRRCWRRSTKRWAKALGAPAEAASDALLRRSTIDAAWALRESLFTAMKVLPRAFAHPTELAAVVRYRTK